METFFLRPDIYSELYNCSQFDYKGWSRFGTKNVPLGIACILLGVVLQMIYLPFIITMCQDKFLKNSCYKMMFYLGIIDFITLYSSSFISGYLSIKGAVFCMYPALIYFAGLCGFAAWASSCVTCMLLTINRCMDIYFPQLAHKLFHGYRTWIALMLPIGIYVWVVLFEPPMTYNSRFLSWFLNPYYGMGLPESTNPVYHSYLHTIVNVVTVIVLFVGNLILCIYVIRRTKVIGMEKSFVFQRQFLLQVFVISIPFFYTALLYVYMQFFSAPFWITFTASLAFIYNSGNAALTYLFLNPTLRLATAELFIGLHSRTKPSHPSHYGGFSSRDLQRRLPRGSYQHSHYNNANSGQNNNEVLPGNTLTPPLHSSRSSRGSTSRY